jgi:hypothetical protein
MDVTAKDALRRVPVTFSRVALPGESVLNSVSPEAEGNGVAADFESGRRPAVSEAGKQGDPDSPCIRVKFGIAERGKAGVTETFAALSAYIREGGLFLPDAMIRLGDYIDLEGGLEVEGYRGRGCFRETALDYRELGGRGSHLRLVVTGINPFHSGRRRKTAEGAYATRKARDRRTAKENDRVPHVAFQFQNIPVVRQMNVSCSNMGGYAASEMRRYLTDADGDGTGGAFLEGLLAAGVPKAALWAPARYMALPAGKGGMILQDLLWLPVEGELFGRVPGAAPEDGEAEDQALLAYYAGRGARRKLHNGGKMCYWTASPVENYRAFSYVDNRGRRRSAEADMELGCAPAFCVG